MFACDDEPGDFIVDERPSLVYGDAPKGNDRYHSRRNPLGWGLDVDSLMIHDTAWVVSR